MRDEGRRAHRTGLPPDILAQSARRLRILALLYAGVFFMAGFFPALLFATDRARLLSSFAQWGPGVVSIAIALVVATLTAIPRIPIRWIMHIGLGFEVASSFGIAAAEFLDPSALDFGARWVGLSWVAVWTLLFTVVVPNSPRRTVVAALASVSSVPLVIGFVVANSPVPGGDPRQGLLWTRLPVSPRCRHGLRGRSGRLLAGQGGDARAGAGGL